MSIFNWFKSKKKEEGEGVNTPSPTKEDKSNSIKPESNVIKLGNNRTALVDEKGNFIKFIN